MIATLFRNVSQDAHLVAEIGHGQPQFIAQLATCSTPDVVYSVTTCWPFATLRMLLANSPHVVEQGFSYNSTSNYEQGTSSYDDILFATLYPRDGRVVVDLPAHRLGLEEQADIYRAAGAMLEPGPSTYITRP